MSTFSQLICRFNVDVEVARAQVLNSPECYTGDNSTKLQKVGGNDLTCPQLLGQ